MFTSTGWQEEFARGSDIGTAEGKERKKKKETKETKIGNFESLYYLRKKKKKKSGPEGTSIGRNHWEVEGEREDEEVASYVLVEGSAYNLRSVPAKDLKEESLIVSSDSQINNCGSFIEYRAKETEMRQITSLRGHGNHPCKK